MTSNKCTVISGSDPCAVLKTEVRHPGVLNATTILTNLWCNLWKSPRGAVIRIELPVVLAAIMLLYLAIIGNFRRRSTNFFVQKGVMGAFILSSSVVTYTIGSMQSSQVKSAMYPIWAISLFILYGCADSVTAYSLEDNNQKWRQIYQACLYYTYILLIVCTFIWNDGGSTPVILSLVVAAYKFMHRIVSSVLASESWQLNKMVADYMYEEHTKSTTHDASSMRGYHYLVDWSLDKFKLDVGMPYTARLEDDAQVIDTEKIWLCTDGSLSTELKDSCLSFALFHLLRRRFFGFACGESAHEKTRDFVFKGLLQSKNGDGSINYNRVFNVIEVEMAFMHDFFFTKYALIYYASTPALVWSLASAILITIIAYLTTSQTVIYNVQGGYCVMNNTTTDTVITVLMLAFIALLELLQSLVYWMTIWGRVSFVCQYLREQTSNRMGSCCLRFKEVLAKIGVFLSNKCFYYWQDKLGQYSLLESVSYNPNPTKRALGMMSMLKVYRCLFLLDLRAINHRYFYAPLHYCKFKPGKPIKLPAQVKEAVNQSLICTQGRLMNGASRLVSNGAGRLTWACQQDMHPDHTSCSQKKENQTHTILTWHIATCYCEMALLKHPCSEQQREDQLKLHIQVATALSKYCAYLVVSAPKFLPGHHYDTELMFREVAEEARQFLVTKRDKYEAMKSLSPDPTTNKTFESGIKLGKQLEEMPTFDRWKVLADFWAEMILYLAPSDNNVKEHIEQLAKGGEFITLLWALLSHAGILKREELHSETV